MSPLNNWCMTDCFLFCYCLNNSLLSIHFPRYVLISRPTEWADKLREKFLEGLDAFLELLKCMQVEAYVCLSNVDLQV